MGHRDGTDDGCQSDFNFLGHLTYYLEIENNIEIHFSFIKLLKRNQMYKGKQVRENKMKQRTW